MLWWTCTYPDGKTTRGYNNSLILSSDENMARNLREMSPALWHFENGIDFASNLKEN